MSPRSSTNFPLKDKQYFDFSQKIARQESTNN